MTVGIGEEAPLVDNRLGCGNGVGNTVGSVGFSLGTLDGQGVGCGLYVDINDRVG